MLPEGFVYIDDIDPSIKYDIRYATTQNFLGEIVSGYKVNRAIGTLELANALSNIQKLVSKDGYSLLIYDTYRPVKAVEHFGIWASSDSVIDVKSSYYPYIDKSKSFELGYIGHRSAHSRGSTVDLTLIRKDSVLRKADEVIKTKRILPDGKEITFIDDGSLDMGSHFDLFDKASWHEDSIFSGEFLERRLYLRNIMLNNGFDDYRKEWWHYSLLNEPYPDTRFNFDVK
ncbi:MAG UNVERIFIED_CONTAM: M15 family metallopeptidase [Rickettsiaceae bacterium]|jgi:D-alanyl-D-alanine dipeptidase